MGMEKHHRKRNPTGIRRMEQKGSKAFMGEEKPNR